MVWARQRSSEVQPLSHATRPAMDQPGWRDLEPLESRLLLSAAPTALDDPYELPNGPLVVASPGGPVAPEETIEFPGGGTPDFLLTVSGGEVRTQPGDLTLGQQSSTYGDVTVTGPGSQWILTSQFYNGMPLGGWLEIGGDGHGRLAVSNGGRVSTPNWTEVGARAPGVGYVFLTGAGSRWDNAGFLSVADDGGRGFLSITDGAYLNNGNWCEIGRYSGSVGSALIAGPDSRWDNFQFLAVGASGGRGELAVLGGGVLNSNNWTEIGQGTGSVGRVVVAGTGSVWTNANWMAIGGGGQGTLVVADGGLAQSGWIDIGSGGRILGDGTVRAGRITNAGLVAPGASVGVLVIDGALEQSATGVLEFEIGGRTRGAQYDGLEVARGLQANGKVVFKFVHGFAPKAGDEFAVVQATGAVSGQFAGFEIQGLAPGFRYTTVFQNGVLKLRALNNGVSLTAPHAASVGVLANDSDSSGDPLTAILVERPAHGALTLFADGSFSYAPGAGFTETDSFRYKATDGFLESRVATVTITNLPPVAIGDAYTVAEDALLPVTPADGVLANDRDTTRLNLSAILVNGPKYGTVALSPDGSFTYRPDANFSSTDLFTYRTSDGFALSPPASVTLTVTPVNDAPVATDDAVATNEDTPTTGNVLANDTDVDGDALSATLLAGPANGSLSLDPDGSFTYVPNANYNGADVFTYKASDGQAESNVAVVTVTVKPVNDDPVAEPDSKTTGQNRPLSFPASDLAANDTDVDGDALAVTAVAATADTHGTVALADGIVTYSPEFTFSGPASFTYSVSDGQGGSAAGIVTVTVRPDQPTLGSASGAGGLDDGARSFSFNVKGGDRGDGLEFSGQVSFRDVQNHLTLRSTSVSLLHVEADGTHATFTGLAEVNGAAGYTFRVEVDDGGATGKSDRFRIQITGPGLFHYDSLAFAAEGGLIDRGNLHVRPRAFPMIPMPGGDLILPKAQAVLLSTELPAWDLWPYLAVRKTGR